MLVCMRYLGSFRSKLSVSFHRDNISGYSNQSVKVTMMELFHHYMFWLELFLKNLCVLFMSFNC